MYRVRKTFEIAGAHSLSLSYPSKCENLHGHNWIITLELSRETLDVNGMVYDFTQIKQFIIQPLMELLDHKNLNDVFEFNPTAENIAQYIHSFVNGQLMGATVCSKVEVQESPNNVAVYEVE